MSIDDATPADWDALRTKHPRLMKKYEKMVEDEVNSPKHYNYGKVECIEAIEESMTPEAFRGYLKGNTMKYLWRYERKGKAMQDLQKAQWYLNKLINSGGIDEAVELALQKAS
jgi:hypothetical protein|tara:strand:- start:2441 stop:2779 length:339 start_codon:yes stop_codon:yes gene_type:complete